MFVPPEALGFLPRRETTEVWLHLQAHIEVMLMYQQDYCGLLTDLKRAFNHIGRDQVFMIAEHVGIPCPFLNPWKKFLHVFERRFLFWISGRVPFLHHFNADGQLDIPRVHEGILPEGGGILIR